MSISLRDTTGKSIQQLLENTSFNDQIRIQRVVFDRLPTNHHANQMDAEVEDKCKECRMILEDGIHVFRCKSANRVAVRESMLSQLRKHFKDTWTPKIKIEAVILGFQSWIDDIPTPDIVEEIPSASLAVRMAYKDQTEIGWDQLIR